MMQSCAAALVACGLMSVSAAHADVVVSGNAASLTVTAQQAERTAVIAAIVERLNLSVEGRSREAGTIDGSFTGTLSEVLNTVLQSEGYAVAYRDGRPSRISFASHGGGNDIHTRDTLALPPSEAPVEAPVPSPEPTPVESESPVPSLQPAPAAVVPEAPQQPTGWTPDTPAPEGPASPYPVSD